MTKRFVSDVDYSDTSMLLINKYMNKFKPTTLYIKQHNETGLKYFGKTTQNIETYSGSGLYWKEHLKIHGNNVTTIWSEIFENKESLTEFAIKFSDKNNIVESDEWANLKTENGLDGFTVGHTYNVGKPSWNKGISASEDHRAKNSLAQLGNTSAKAVKGHKQTLGHIEKRMRAHRGIEKGPQSAEHIASRFKQKQCEYCGGYFSPTNHSRWHRENCKNK